MAAANGLEDALWAKSLARVDGAIHEVAHAVVEGVVVDLGFVALRQPRLGSATLKGPVPAQRGTHMLRASKVEADNGQALSVADMDGRTRQLLRRHGLQALWRRELVHPGIVKYVHWNA